MLDYKQYWFIQLLDNFISKFLFFSANFISIVTIVFSLKFTIVTSCNTELAMAAAARSEMPWQSHSLARFGTIVLIWYSVIETLRIRKNEHQHVCQIQDQYEKTNSLHLYFETIVS